MIHIENLVKRYGDLVALNHLSLDIHEGEIFGLLGPNGCGKTTLLKILAGVIHDYDGKVAVNGYAPGPESKATTAFLPDTTYLEEYFRTIDAINYFDDFFSDFDKVEALDFAQRFSFSSLCREPRSFICSTRL